MSTLIAIDRHHYLVFYVKSLNLSQRMISSVLVTTHLKSLPYKEPLWIEHFKALYHSHLFTSTTNGWFSVCNEHAQTTFWLERANNTVQLSKLHILTKMFVYLLIFFNFVSPINSDVYFSLSKQKRLT